MRLLAHYWWVLVGLIFALLFISGRAKLK